MPRIHSHREAGERYPVLRITGAICTGLGLLLLAAGGLLLLVGAVVLTTDLGRPLNGLGVGVGLIWAIGLLASGLQTLAMGAFFRLAIHVEENTRATAQALEKLRQGGEPKPVADPLSIFLS